MSLAGAGTADSGLVLHHDWASTCSQSVRLALAEKGLAWEGRVVRLRHFEHLAPGFIALSPDAFVPVLEHAGFIVREASVINVYLDAVFPAPPLLPADARGRAEVGMWLAFTDQVTSPAIKKPSFARHCRVLIPPASPLAHLQPIIDSAMEGKGPSSSEAIASAHDNPVVQALWARFALACDYVPLNTLGEAQDMFAEFEAVDLPVQP